MNPLPRTVCHKRQIALGRAIVIRHSRSRIGHLDFPSLNNKNMFREILGFLGILLIVKIALPSEVSDLITEILMNVLNIIRDSLSQIR